MNNRILRLYEPFSSTNTDSNSTRSEASLNKLSKTWTNKDSKLSIWMLKEHTFGDYLYSSTKTSFFSQWTMSYILTSQCNS